MRRASAWAALGAGGALVLAGCSETQLGAQVLKDVARTDAPVQATSQAELAPESFDATGLTIWDGARTLQGVWVAHPLAQRAQRVRVLNIENGLEVEGAMFRRDPALSGPSILVSSDTAFSLGLQPGRPTELRIIALKEGVYAAEPAADGAQPAGDVETAALAPLPEVDRADEEERFLEEEAVAAEEIAPEPAEEPAPAPAEAEEPATIAAEEVAPTTAEEVAAAPAPAEPPTPAPEPVEEEVETAAADPTFTVAPEDPVAPAPAPRPEAPSARGVSPGNIGVAAADEDGRLTGELPKGVFVQAGAFRVEPNAQSLVAKLRGAGQPAQYVQRGSAGNPLNIVMIGPLDGDASVEAAITAAEAAGVSGARKVVR